MDSWADKPEVWVTSPVGVPEAFSDWECEGGCLPPGGFIGRIGAAGSHPDIFWVPYVL